MKQSIWYFLGVVVCIAAIFGGFAWGHHEGYKKAVQERNTRLQTALDSLDGYKYRITHLDSLYSLYLDSVSVLNAREAEIDTFIITIKEQNDEVRDSINSLDLRSKRSFLFERYSQYKPD